MAGLPKLPGFNFSDPSVTRFNLSHAFDFCNGYKMPKHSFDGIGGKPPDTNSVGYIGDYDPVRYDPSLTYGRTRAVAVPRFLPHYALYDKKCLTFKAYFKQSVVESPLEHYRVRHVNIIYFLEDDTITVMEPKVENSGLVQGRLIKRALIPKTTAGEYWTWKDLDVGRDVAFYGIVYHTYDCDTFTREYMASQGLVMGQVEMVPPDPYTQDREFQKALHVTQTPSADNKLRRFLEYDGKILKFRALWDDRDSEHGEIRPYEVLYFLADDTIAVKEVHTRNDGRDPFPQLLRKTKLPKVWTDRPVTFPSIYLERTDDEVTEYYQPKDLLVGETVFVLGRRMLLYDCDEFTRNYFRKVLNVEQRPAVDVEERRRAAPRQKMPPHDGFGSLEDSLQNTLTFLPKSPKKDVLRQILNANKCLRYEMKFDVVHPEDSVRRFLFIYQLGDGTCTIYEPPIKNSGIIGGKYLRSSLLKKPGGDPLNPEYYTPADFYIGAVITVFRQRFIITGADLYVYRYVQANPEKFPAEVVENVRNYMFKRGLLDDDVQDQIEENDEALKKARRDAIGKQIEEKRDEMEKCMQELNVGAGVDSASEERTRKKILDEYEDSLVRRHEVPEHGIEKVNKTCAYPIEVGELKSTECSTLEGQYAFAPKHVDTPEEIRQKYYAGVLKRHRDVCAENAAPECAEPPPVGQKPPQPIMVSDAELPGGACKVKTVSFSGEPRRCERDKYDLCDLKTEKTQRDCTDYEK